METKYVYFFGEGKADGDASMKNLLGGKGAIVAIGNIVPSQTVNIMRAYKKGDLVTAGKK